MYVCSIIDYVFMCGIYSALYMYVCSIIDYVFMCRVCSALCEYKGVEVNYYLYYVITIILCVDTASLFSLLVAPPPALILPTVCSPLVPEDM